ncbi:MAG: S8 family peptidase [Armatimonadota bacterium]
MPQNYRIVLAVVVIAVLVVGGCGGGGGGNGGDQPPGAFFEDDSVSTSEPSEVGDIDLPNGQTVEAAADQIIVEVSDGATGADRSELETYLQQHNAEVVAQHPDLGRVLVESPNQATTEQLLAGLSSVQGVRSTLPNITVSINDDTAYDPDPVSFDGDYWIEQIHAKEAWQMAVDRRGEVKGDLVLGMVDSGIDANASFGSGQIQIMKRYWFFTGYDEIGHGTHVAGLMVAPGDDGYGACGVAWGNTLQVYDWYAEAGTIDKLFVWDIAEAITAAIKDGAKVVNVSAGADTHRYDASGNVIGFVSHSKCIARQQSFRENMSAAVRLAASPGYSALIAFAAGNDGAVVKDDNQLLPPLSSSATDEEIAARQAALQAWASNAVIVAATDDAGNETSFTREGTVVDIAAPGACIGSAQCRSLPTRPECPQPTTPGVRLQSGTSMSAPIVAGVAGLSWSFDPSLSAYQVKELIVTSGGESRTDIGGGIVNAARALPPGSGDITISQVPFDFGAARMYPVAF